MAKFNATSVEKLGYDFEMFKQGKGDIQEPDSDQIADFWADYSEVLAVSRERSAGWAEKLEDEKLTAEDREDLEREAAAWRRENAKQMVARRREMLSALCSGDPNVEQLTALPGRVLDAFESYMMDAISPNR